MWCAVSVVYAQHRAVFGAPLPPPAPGFICAWVTLRSIQQLQMASTHAPAGSLFCKTRTCCCELLVALGACTDHYYFFPHRNTFTPKRSEL